MPIPMNSVCAQCLMGRHVENARRLGDDATATAFAKGIMQAFLDMPEEADSSLIGREITKLYTKYYGLGQDRYQEEKVQSNAFVMERLPQIRQMVAQSENPVYTALQFSVLGNYLDFAALHGQVKFEDLEKMLLQACDMDLTGAGHDRFCQDLAKARRVVVITDNAGEIVFDWVLAENLQKAYPDLEVTFLVRGGPANNDATREDTKAIGLPYDVVDSGVCVGGTPLKELSPQAMTAVHSADVLIAKGMGNTESLYGCGLNVYYAFLVKCKRFEQFFGKPHLTPMFVAEPR